jgi:PAS domain S-box-containing protein
MEDQDKTKEQLVNELVELRQRIADLEKLEVKRKRTEEALRKSEERYRTILDNIEDGYFEVDIEGNFTFFNGFLCRMLGYSIDEMMGMNNRQYMDKENAQKVYQTFNQVYATGEPYRAFDWGIVRKDDTKRFVESSVSLLRDAKGKPIGFRGIVRDITDRKFAEEALRRSEEEAKRLAQENALMAEIGEIISSTLNIEEVYGRFAEEVHKIIPFDRIVINIINIEKNTVSNVYMAGKGIADRKVGEIYPLKGSGNVEMVRTNSSLLIQTEDFDEYKDRFPLLLSTFQAGFRSIMNVPLFSKGKIIGGLLLRSLKPYAYTDKDVRLAERVANQIAGAIANAQLFIERKRALEDREQLILQLQKALTEVKQLSGLLPICASCKKIRDDKGYWNQIESYIRDHSGVEFSHGICPDCMKKLYPDL